MTLTYSRPAYRKLGMLLKYVALSRSLMYSEANRRETFTSWPHAGYRWAQPDPMAQAGFYHQVGTERTQVYISSALVQFLSLVPCNQMADVQLEEEISLQLTQCNHGDNSCQNSCALVSCQLPKASSVFVQWNNEC